MKLSFCKHHKRILMTSVEIVTSRRKITTRRKREYVVKNPANRKAKR